MPLPRVAAAAGLAALCLLVLTMMAVVLFIQHEADRDAAINASRPPAAAGSVACPADPSSPRYNAATAVEVVSALSEC